MKWPLLSAFGEFSLPKSPKSFVTSHHNSSLCDFCILSNFCHCLVFCHLRGTAVKQTSRKLSEFLVCQLTTKEEKLFQQAWGGFLSVKLFIITTDFQGKYLRCFYERGLCSSLALNACLAQELCLIELILFDCYRGGLAHPENEDWPPMSERKCCQFNIAFSYRRKGHIALLFFLLLLHNVERRALNRVEPVLHVVLLCDPFNLWFQKQPPPSLPLNLVKLACFLS